MILPPEATGLHVVSTCAAGRSGSGLGLDLGLGLGLGLGPDLILLLPR